jgi:SAM-dependent methyltransferase
MIYLFYFFRSLYYRGVFNTLRMLYFELTKDKQYGIKTTLITNKTEDPDNYHYQGASYYILEKLFEKLYQNYPEYTLVDVGCGKGRAMFVAERKGFKQLYGFDIDPELIALAKSNITCYKWKQTGSTFQIEVKDALKAEIPQIPCIYYLFNPFSDKILMPFIQRIKQETKSPFLVVYLNPKFENCLKESGLSLKETIYTGRYKEAVIYTSD